MIELLLCDDSHEARAALRTMLADHDEITIVGEAENGEDAVALAIALAPDVVLMDLSMPIVDGVEATRRISSLLPDVRVVAFSGSDDSESIGAMMDAGAVAYCIKGAPLWELERAIAGRSDPLVRLAHGLARATNRVGIGTMACRELLELTGAGTAAVYVASPDVALSLAGFAGRGSGDRLAAAPGIVVRAFSLLGTIVADDADLDELEHLGLPSADALAVPLVADGDALGALLLTMTPGTALTVDADFVEDIAGLAASALATERRLALTHAEARRDALTGLANRRAYEERLDAAFRRADATRGEVTIVVLDLDDFKRFNDTGGHAAGDAVLTQVGRVALRVLRAGEELFRVGGDEFAVVLEGPAAAGVEVAERIATALATHTRGDTLPTISAGVASYPSGARSKTELEIAADNALYSSKRRRPSRAVPHRPRGDSTAGMREPADHPPVGSRGARVLLVDDDPALLTLLRTTFELVDIELQEAHTAAAATAAVAARPPDVVVLDIGLPDFDGLTLCRQLKSDPLTSWIGVVLLTGAGEEAAEPARRAGADAFLRKPFSPLDLLEVVERLAGGLEDGPFRAFAPGEGDEQLLLYANDLRRLLQIERGRKDLLQRTYRQTVAALAAALESKDFGTGLHSQRVQRYALELSAAIEPQLLQDPSVEFGFLLHDVGKIGIPDHVLQKRGPLDDSELRLMRTHTVLGEQLLRDVDLLHGDGLRVVRSHHERWDGLGYPDGLVRLEIPLAARVFSVADALDAMTSDRPYRSARTWDEAVGEILSERGRQFDPDVVDVFRDRERALQGIRCELATV
ncbi:MAG TPA: response regulator [Gaiellaceae bacterium]